MFIVLGAKTTSMFMVILEPNQVYLYGYVGATPLLLFMVMLKDWNSGGLANSGGLKQYVVVFCNSHKNGGGTSQIVITPKNNGFTIKIEVV